MVETLKRMIMLLWKRKKGITFLVLANFLYAFLILIEPIFFKHVIDLLVSFSEQTSASYSTLLQVLLLWVWVWIISITVRLYVSIFSDRLTHEEYDKNVFSFFNHIECLSMRFHTNANSGQLVKKITKWVDGIFQTQLDFIRRVMPNVFTILILIPLVLYFNLKLWLFVVIVWFLSSVVSFYLAAKTFQKQNEIEGVYNDMSTLYGDTFSNINIVKSFTLGFMKNSELRKLTDVRLAKQYPILNWWWLIVSFSQILRIIVSIGVIFFGSYLFVQWEISIGEIVMFLSFSMIFLACVEDLTWTLEWAFWRLAGIKDFFEIIDTKAEVVDKKDSKSLGRVNGDIHFDSVNFSYDGKRQILKNIDISVQQWEKIAFVWHTGSWKTTMTNLLLRFFEVQSWDIRVDGTSIYDVTQESLRKNIWVVFQDNSLFNATILENIRLDNTNATLNQIQEVAEKSHASDFIKNLSDGFDTMVGERWVKLSGGEKQRLAIARAFLKDAPILILDEATSALDAETEQYLQWSFDELMKGRTTFIIAHRLSTIKKADRIFVFDNGSIVEQGTYSELVSKKWPFSKLVAAQTDGFVE